MKNMFFIFAAFLSLNQLAQADYSCQERIRQPNRMSNSPTTTGDYGLDVKWSASLATGKFYSLKDSTKSFEISDIRDVSLNRCGMHCMDLLGVITDTKQPIKIKIKKSTTLMNGSQPAIEAEVTIERSATSPQQSYFMLCEFNRGI